MSVLGHILRRRGFGAIQDPVDARDMKLTGVFGSHAGVTIPAAGSVANSLVVPRDQDGTNSCVGQAWSQGLRLAYLKLGKSCPALSARYCYWGRSLHNMGNVDQGTYQRSVAKFVMMMGVSAESAMPFSVWDINKPPGNRAVFSGYDHRGLRGYYRIEEGDVVGIKRAISLGFPVVGSWPVDRVFMDHTGTSRLLPMKGGFLGNHAMLIESFDDEGGTIMNSYGLRWGMNGKSMVTNEWLASGFDFWALDVNGQQS